MPGNDPGTAALVEDNLMQAMQIEPQLRSLGYQVRTLAPGPEAVEALARHAPALVLVNLTSTRFAGANLVRQIRQHPDLAKVPVVGYAGHVERQFFQAGREAGADMVVPNSAMSRALPEVLRKLERRMAGGAEEEWEE